MSELVAGVDSSTQSTKVVVVDPDDGSVVATGHAPHPVEGTGGARETDPAAWVGALALALEQTGRAADVGAVSVGGQQHGLVVMDGQGLPLRPAPLWHDTRSAQDAAALVGALGGPQVWAERMGVLPVASFTISKWAWLRRVEPDVAAATRQVCLPHDWLIRALTGTAATDRGDASGTGWWSGHDERYAADVLDLPAVRLDAGMLPRVLGPGEAAGTVRSSRPKAGSAFERGSLGGLPEGCLVGPGTGDNMGAALGLAVDVGTPVMSLGTSGTVFAVADRCPADASGTVAGFADATGRFLPLACTLNATTAVDRVAGWLGLDRDAVEPGGEVVVLPYLDGERTPNLPLAAGTIAGLRHETTPGQILRAAYEGAVASLLTALDVFTALGVGPAPDAPVVLVGGGARGRAWQDTVRRLSGRAVVVPRLQEAVAYGAAAQAAAVLTGEAPHAVAKRWGGSAGTVLEPLPRDDAALQRLDSVRSAAAGLLGLGR